MTVITCDYDEPEEPCTGDWVTEDFRTFWQHDYPRQCRLEVEGDDWAVELYERMQLDSFWPDVWSLSDHGNYCLLKDWRTNG